jgi:ABC-type transporter Mla subunit MlaD
MARTKVLLEIQQQRKEAEELTNQIRAEREALLRTIDQAKESLELAKETARETTKDFVTLTNVTRQTNELQEETHQDAENLQKKEQSFQNFADNISGYSMENSHRSDYILPCASSEESLLDYLSVKKRNPDSIRFPASLEEQRWKEEAE